MDANWRMPLSFAVFYAAVCQNNSDFVQGDVVNLLLNGTSSPEDAPLGKEIVNRYIRGKRAIARQTVSTFLRLDESSVVERLRKSGIHDPVMGASCLNALIGSGHIELTRFAKDELQDCDYAGETYRYLAICLQQAIRCTQENLMQLNQETIDEIISYRTAMTNGETEAITPVSDEPEPVPAEPNSGTDDGDQARVDTQKPVLLTREEAIAAMEPIQVPMVTISSVSALDYRTEREQIKSLLFAGRSDDMKRKLEMDEIHTILEKMRHSKKSYQIDLQGTPEGLGDVLFHRIREGECTQICFIFQTNRQSTVKRLRTMMGNFTRYYLHDDGIMAFAYGFDSTLRMSEFRMKVIYSLSSYTEEDDRRDKIIDGAHYIPLNPWDQYEDRVPDFLSPNAKVRNASGDI